MTSTPHRQTKASSSQLGLQALASDFKALECCAGYEIAAFRRRFDNLKSKVADLVSKKDKEKDEEIIDLLSHAREAMEMLLTPGDRVKLTVGGECIVEVAKEILKKHSPYFAALFDSGMMEADAGEIACDESFTPTVVRAVIGAVAVSGGKRLFEVEKLTFADVLGMIVVASRWQLDTLFTTVVAALRAGEFTSLDSVGGAEESRICVHPSYLLSTDRSSLPGAIILLPRTTITSDRNLHGDTHKEARASLALTLGPVALLEHLQLARQHRETTAGIQDISDAWSTVVDVLVRHAACKDQIQSVADSAAFKNMSASEVCEVINHVTSISCIEPPSVKDAKFYAVLSWVKGKCPDIDGEDDPAAVLKFLHDMRDDIMDDPTVTDEDREAVEKMIVITFDFLVMTALTGSRGARDKMMIKTMEDFGIVERGGEYQGLGGFCPFFHRFFLR